MEEIVRIEDGGMGDDSYESMLKGISVIKQTLDMQMERYLEDQPMLNDSLSYLLYRLAWKMKERKLSWPIQELDPEIRMALYREIFGDLLEADRLRREKNLETSSKL